MNSANDRVNFLSRTILGLKTALIEAEKESQTLQKLLLSFYVKDAAKETNLYKMNRSGAKMNEIFQKEKQQLFSKIQELEGRLSDSERENLNLNFQVKELKAFVEEKTSLLDLYNSKDAKPEKQTLSSFKEKDLVQIVKNVLARMEDGRVSRELRKCLRKIEHRNFKHPKTIKSETSDAEVSGDEVNLMSVIVENRLKDDEFSIKWEKNDLSSHQSICHSSETFSDNSSVRPNDEEINSSHNDAVACIGLDQPVLSPLSIADSDYGSNGVKSVESLILEKVYSAESSCVTDILPTELVASEMENSALKKLPELLENSSDCIRSDDLITDVEDSIENGEFSYFPREVLNSVVDSILDEMACITYSSFSVESFEKFCLEDSTLYQSSCLNHEQGSPVIVSNADDFQSCETIPCVMELNSDSQSEKLVFGKRKIDVLPDQNEFKKSKLDENTKSSLPGTQKNTFLSKDDGATHGQECVNVITENILTREFEGVKNIAIVSNLENDIIGNNFKGGHLETVDREELLVSNNRSIENYVEIRVNDTQSCITSPSRDVLIERRVDTSIKSNEYSSSDDKHSIGKPKQDTTQSDIGLSGDCLEKSVASSSISLAISKPSIFSIFDVEPEIAEFGNISALETITALNEEISASDDYDSFADFARKKSNIEESIINDECLLTQSVNSNLSNDAPVNVSVKNPFFFDDLFCPDDETSSDLIDQNIPLKNVAYGTCSNEKDCVPLLPEKPRDGLVDTNSPSLSYSVASDNVLEIVAKKEIADLLSFEKSAEKHLSDSERYSLHETYRESPITNSRNISENDNATESENRLGNYEEWSSAVVSTNAINCVEEVPLSVTLRAASDAFVEKNSGTIDFAQSNDSLWEYSDEPAIICTNEENLIQNYETRDVFSILNKFAVLGKKMCERISTFKEFLLQDGSLEESDVSSKNEDYYSKTQNGEYIVVAEIIGDCDRKSSDVEIESRDAFVDDCSLRDDVVHSLHEIEMKTVQLHSFDRCLSYSPKFSVSSYVPMPEINDASDEEEHGLVIVEDNCDDTIINEDETSIIDLANIGDDENNCAFSNKDLNQKLVEHSESVDSTLRKNQPIKEITNVSRYNFRRFAIPGDSACALVPYRSVSLPLTKNSLSSKQNSDFINSKSAVSDTEETSEKLQMKFYVESQLSYFNSPSSSYLSTFDEIWDRVKISHVEKSSQLITDASELIPCPSSVINLVFDHGKTRNTKLRMQNERVSNLSLVKKSLEAFLKEKIRNYATAFNAFSEIICNSNSTTLCCAMTEILKDVTILNARIQENIIREFVTLSTKIDRGIFKGFVDTLKSHLKTAMWVRDWEAKKNVSGCFVNFLRLLSKLEAKLCKLTNDIQSVISLLRDCLFSFKYRCHPIAHSILEEWPEIFPQNPEQRSLIDHIILFTLVNHKMEYNKNLFKYEEVQQLVRNLYNVKLGMKTAEEHAKELMLQFNEDTWSDAITLLCKRQMFAWTYTNVIMKYFLPLVNKWKTELFREEILRKALGALRVLLASCPVQEENNKIYSLDVIVNALKEILFSEKAGSRELKEIIILILCDLSSVRFSTCADVLFMWRPVDGVISTNTFQQLHERMVRNYKSNWRCLLNPNNNSKKTQAYKYKRSPNCMKSQFVRSVHSGRADSVMAVGVSKKMEKMEVNNSKSGKKKKKKRKAK